VLKPGLWTSYAFLAASSSGAFLAVRRQFETGAFHSEQVRSAAFQAVPQETALTSSELSGVLWLQESGFASRWPVSESPSQLWPVPAGKLPACQTAGAVPAVSGLLQAVSFGFRRVRHPL
jgi:hypothetical protein